ncbi:MAG: thiamine pyrophosphate-dependent enzyme [Actinomycetota bacterium]|nr:thiamine pyrophosphate-dependent enzyme [Actinomycetota bacterium]
MLSESIAGVVPLGRDVGALVAQVLADLGVRHAFGVSGGGIGRMWRALIDRPEIETLHFRHEAGAAFAATEASVERDGPVAVFCTTGPGMTNSMTGLAAARAEGAKLVLISPRTSPVQRGRGAVQETPMPSADFFTPGWLFDEVFMMESAEEVTQVAYRLQHGFGRVGPYIAHLSIPIALQSAAVRQGRVDLPGYRLSAPFPEPGVVDEVAQLLAAKRFAIWVGHGARHAARQVRALVDLTGAPVLVTPRGKGVVPEDHPQLVMVTGLGGHAGGIEHLARYGPEVMLVLGTRLGEPSSGWEERLIPPGGLVHVDIDPAIPGTAFGAPLLAVQADIGAFLDQLLVRSHEIPHRCFHCDTPFGEPPRHLLNSDLVRPSALFAVTQKAVVDAGIPVLVEPGSAMAWAANLLKMSKPAQLRIVGGFGSMGQMTCGVIGAALARHGPAVCLSGDGSMLMNNEISTAVEYGIPAIWVVLNNAGYQMCEKGMGFGPAEPHARFRRCDFVRVARGMGAQAVAVRRESELEPAFRRAIGRGGPFLLDVMMDPDEAAPFESRFKTLR